MVMPLIPERFAVEPFALSPAGRQAAEALDHGLTAARQVAWAPIPFDQGDESPFLERWIGWLAEAAAGRLAQPRSMPEQSGGHWR